MRLPFRCPETPALSRQQRPHNRKHPAWSSFLLKQPPPPPPSPPPDSMFCWTGDNFVDSLWPQIESSSWIKMARSTARSATTFPAIAVVGCCCFMLYLLFKRFRRTPNYENDFKGLCKAIKSNTKSLTSVVISKNLERVDFTKLAECLEQNTNVQSMDLFLPSSSKSSSGSSFERLFKYILSSSSLERIALSGDFSPMKSNSNSSSEVTDLFLAFVSTNPLIQSVELTNVSVSVEALCDLLVRTSKLEHLMLQSISITTAKSNPSDGPEKLASSFLFNSTLRSIDLRGYVKSSSSESSLSRGYWLSVLQKLPFHAVLETLHVDLADTVENDRTATAKDVTDAIRDIVDSPVLSNFRRLSISGAHFDVNNLDSFSECLVVGDDRRPCTIRDLRLQHCHFDADATLRFELIVQANNSIERLSLGPNVDFEGGLVLSTMLHENQNIQELQLDQLNSELVSPTEFQLLWKHLESSDRKLQCVSFGTIEDIDICRGLVHSLPLFSSLRFLTVGLGDKLIEFKNDVLSALEKNNSLHETIIHANFWNNRDQRRIKKYCERNQSVRTLNSPEM